MVHKRFYLARRAAHVSREEWPATWKDHAVLASQIPVLKEKVAWMRYCNRVEAPTLPQFSQDYDGVGVFGGQSLERLNEAGLTEDEIARITEDEIRVFDLVTRSLNCYCTENLIQDGPLRSVAVFTFLARRPDLSREEFHERWNGRHAEVAAAVFQDLGGNIRYAHNPTLYEPKPIFPFDGITEAWFPSVEDALNASSGSGLDPLRRDLRKFIDPSRSLAMLTSVCHPDPE